MESSMEVSSSMNTDYLAERDAGHVAGRRVHGELRVSRREAERDDDARKRPGRRTHVHRLSDQTDRLRGRLDREQLVDLLIELLALLQRGELRDLRHELLVVHGLHRILIGKLR